jgi:peptidoglycan hydrolase-like protein with peptidoglycan-binding domain
MESKHAHASTERRFGGPAILRLAIAVVALAALGVGIAAFAAGSGPASSASASGGPAAAPKPLTVVSVSPANGTSDVPSDATLSVQFSTPLALHTPTPTLSPPVAGTWELVTPTTLAFVASAPLVPSTTETISVPAGSGGVAAASGNHLTLASSTQFTVGAGSTLRLQQLLAQLGYLPLSFTPAAPLSAPQEAANPQEGTFDWRWPEPASLESLWAPGSANELTRGAVMAFESHHDLTTDGSAGPVVWNQLLADAAAGTVDAAPYNYVVVSTGSPETTTVYSNGSEVYSTLANTGVSAAPTAAGTFPVFARYTVTTMSGTNPDGSHYVDPGIPWVSYFNGGDALHGFVRPGYGYPQSDGCVEMPISNAAVVYPLTPIGTLVTVA